MKVKESGLGDITHQIDKGRQIQAAENCERFAPSVETVILCGRQNLPLRGHVDSGPIDLAEPHHNDGNFRSLLRLLFRKSPLLWEKMQNAPKNASYHSPEVQNEIADAAGRIIRNKLVDRVNNARCFSVLADETADISGIEQLSLCVRYVQYAFSVLSLNCHKIFFTVFFICLI